MFEEALGVDTADCAAQYVFIRGGNPEGVCEWAEENNVVVGDDLRKSCK
jgi:hypothetical protein